MEDDSDSNTQTPDHTDNRLIIIAGPTAAGKSALAVGLAKEIGGAIISADSMQVYRGMDVGSAKIISEETEGVPHYLIDILDPDEEFNIFLFQQKAKEAIAEIRAAGQIPIVTGGTGFYIQALLRDVDFSESGGRTDERERLEALADEKGSAYLHELLAEKDPEAAAQIHPNNRKRVIRALEFFEDTGSKISEHNEAQREKTSVYDAVYFVVSDERGRLYERINRRVDEMIENGLEDEVLTLLRQGINESHISMKGIGYQEWFPYFRGERSLEDTVELIKQNTRHFAKRQLTWFRREPDTVWLERQDYGDDNSRILEEMLRVVRERWA